jgi:hypothetical protein
MNTFRKLSYPTKLVKNLNKHLIDYFMVMRIQIKKLMILKLLKKKNTELIFEQFN